MVAFMFRPLRFVRTEDFVTYYNYRRLRSRGKSKRKFSTNKLESNLNWTAGGNLKKSFEKQVVYELPIRHGRSTKNAPKWCMKITNRRALTDARRQKRRHGAIASQPLDLRMSAE